ncbi:MAG: VCBS repeat-containing protein [Deinococcaceae bacterium]
MYKLLSCAVLSASLLSSCGVHPSPLGSSSEPVLDMQSDRFLGNVELAVGDVGSLVEAQSLAKPSASVGLTLVSSSVPVTVRGMRYFSATYRVNRSLPPGQFVFVPTETETTYPTTSVVSMYNGSTQINDINIARKVGFTGGQMTSGPRGALLDPRAVSPNIQAFIESDVNFLNGKDGIVSAFPVGFKASRSGASTTITVHLSVPVQAKESDTPTRVVLSGALVWDSKVQATEAFEEQSGTSILSRLNSGITQLNTLPGSTTIAPLGVQLHRLCRVQIVRSSFATDPGMFLRSGLEGSSPSLPPALGRVDSIEADGPVALSSSSVTGTLSCGGLSDQPENQFLIQASQTGLRKENLGAFNRGTFVSNRFGQWVYTPAAGAGFKAGEEVDVTLTDPTQLERGFVKRFRVGGAPEGSAGFENVRSTEVTGIQPLSAVGLGDFNSDGKVDAVVSEPFENALLIFMGKGQGGFLEPLKLTTTQPLKDITVKDFNNDGKLDIFALSDGVFGGTSGGELRLGAGDGTFASQVIDTGSLQPSRAATFGDIDGDGWLDLVVANDDDQAAIFLNTHNSASLFVAPSRVAIVKDPQVIALGDINNDGLFDIVTAGEPGANAKVGVSLGAPNAMFQPKQEVNLGTEIPSSLQSGDLDGDHRDDIVVATAGGKVGVLLSSMRKFSSSVVSWTDLGQDIWSSSLGDVNGDGRLDVVATSLFGGPKLVAGGTVNVLPGQGNGHFGSAQQILLSTGSVDRYAFASALGDLNGDGRLDIVSATQGSDDHNLHVLIKK